MFTNLKSTHNIFSGSSQHSIPISRRELLSYYSTGESNNHEIQFQRLVTKVREKTHCENEFPKYIKQELFHFIYQYKKKWQSVSRNKKRFESKYSNWLDTSVHFLLQKRQRISSDSVGRPEKVFVECSDRSKRRKTQELRSNNETVELTYAAEMKLRSEGNVHAAKVLADIIQNPDASNYIKKDSDRKIAKLTEDKALSLLINARLTKYQYNIIRSNALEENCPLYPNYESIIKAKKRCYPDNIVITEISAEIPLQDLLDHTLKRLAISLDDVLSVLEESKLNNLWLISKWGCDGTSGQAEYKQLFENPDVSDASIFISSLVPVQIVCGNPSNTHELIWQNQRSSSPRYCRPIKLDFVHETTEILQNETKYIEEQIKTLASTNLVINGKNVCIKHHLILTMIDGKAINAITQTASTQRCNLCGVTAKDFNNLNYCLNKPIIDEQRLLLGLSSLHCWIRFYECMLNLSYKLKLCKWQARGTANKTLVELEKKRVQQEFKTKLGMLVDQPKPGYGSTNDGNSARRFFSNYEISAEITGISKQLIYRLWIILITMSSGLAINEEKFKIYCLKTAVVFLKLYPWYNMPTTVHRILIHGYIIVQNAVVPIGLLSEEAQESKNKDIKKYREGFTRKFSRKHTMEDLFHQLLISSDPHITSLRKLPQRQVKPYPQDVINLLKEPEISSVS